MTKRLNTFLLAIALCLIAAPAWALSGEYYTWNGFHPMVDTFTQIALVFSDKNYNMIFGVILVMSICGGIARGLVSSAVSSRASLWSWVAPVLLGMAIYQGLIVPTGTLNIYDPVRNETAAVGGIPDGIVMLASAFNAVERGMVDIVDTAGPVDYNSQAGGIAFDMMQNMPSTITFTSQSLNQSISAYIEQCVVPEIADPTGCDTPITPDTLNSNDDFIALFQCAANPGMYTVIYQNSTNSCSNGTGTYASGCPTDCLTAYNQIQSMTTNPTSYSGGIANLCAMNGFDVTNSAELQQCQTIVTSAYNWILNGSYTITNLAQQQAVAQTLTTTLTGMSPNGSLSILASQNAGINMQASGASVAQWMPIMRAATTAVMIALIPFLVAFIITPFSGKVFMLIAGFFALTCTWGVTDAIVHNLAMNEALRQMQYAATYKLGYAAMLRFPIAASKAAAMFQTLRWNSLLLATAITSTFGFLSVTAFSHLAMNLQGAIAAGAGAAAREALTPEGRGHLEQGAWSGLAQQQLFNDPSYGSMFRDQAVYNAQTSAQLVQDKMAAGMTPGREAATGAYNQETGIVQAETLQGMGVSFAGRGVYGAAMEAGGMQFMNNQLSAAKRAGFIEQGADMRQFKSQLNSRGELLTQFGSIKMINDQSGHMVTSTINAGSSTSATDERGNITYFHSGNVSAAFNMKHGRQLTDEAAHAVVAKSGLDSIYTNESAFAQAHNLNNQDVREIKHAIDSATLKAIDQQNDVTKGWTLENKTALRAYIGAEAEGGIKVPVVGGATVKGGLELSNTTGFNAYQDHRHTLSAKQEEMLKEMRSEAEASVISNSVSESHSQSAVARFSRSLSGTEEYSNLQRAVEGTGWDTTVGQNLLTGMAREYQNAHGGMRADQVTNELDRTLSQGVDVGQSAADTAFNNNFGAFAGRADQGLHNQQQATRGVHGPGADNSQLPGTVNNGDFFNSMGQKIDQVAQQAGAKLPATPGSTLATGNLATDQGTLQHVQDEYRKKNLDSHGMLIPGRGEHADVNQIEGSLLAEDVQQEKRDANDPNVWKPGFPTNINDKK